MRIARELYDEIVSHARAQAPEECCGIVATREDEAVTVHRAENAASSARFSFEIAASDLIRITNEIEAAGLELGLMYHSHPRTPPQPSQTDINFGRLWPGVLWLIVGLATGDPDVRAFTIIDGQVAEAELVLS